jgi:Acetyltransferase (GNAT) domain
MQAATLKLPAPVLSRDGLDVRILPGVSATDKASWDAIFPGDAEGWAYYAACEASPPPAFKFHAITVHDGERLIAGSPIFRLTYRLDTPLQGGWRKVGDFLARIMPRYIILPVIGLGSPLGDRCHIGFAPDLNENQRQQAMRALLAGLDTYAAAEKVDILAIKDLGDRDVSTVDAPLKDAKFTRVGSLPVAVLDLAPFKSEDAYLASLSSATRKDMRRKLKGAAAIRIEERGSIADVEAEIVALYDSTRGQSGFDYGDFEKLSPEYFRDVVANLGPQAVTFLYWLDKELIGFNLCFVEDGRMIDKFIGMRYPIARDHNLYVLSWMTNVRYCLKHGIRLMQTGQTAYSSKVRFGSRLDKLWLCFKHRRPFWNFVFSKAGPLVAFDKLDPDLAAIAKREKEAAKAKPAAA